MIRQAPGRPDFDPKLLPEAPSADDPAAHAEAVASEQFVHGLLQHLHRDHPEVQGRRVQAVMAAIGRDDATAPPRTFKLRSWSLLSGAAAAILIFAVLLIGLPSGQTALAVVQTSIEASRTAGDRSYEVRVTPPGDTEVGAQLMARIDLRGADHVFIEATAPEGHRVVVGRNPDGAWAVRRDGSIDHYPPRHVWPRWINFGQSTFLIASVDSLLETLPSAYELELRDPEPLPDTQGLDFERVTALHEQRPSPEPRRIELWIDAGSRLVHRMELHWPPQPAPLPPPPPDDDHLGPPPPHDDPFGRPPPPDGHRPGPPPAFIAGPPDFRGGRHPPPPRTILFEMVDTAPFPDGWFLPETHQQQ